LNQFFIQGLQALCNRPPSGLALTRGLSSSPVAVWTVLVTLSGWFGVVLGLFRMSTAAVVMTVKAYRRD
jgi:hypothetical protein